MSRSSGATRIADARVVATVERYLRLARNVRCPGAASSTPATSVISIPASPSSLQASRSAISPSFIAVLLSMPTIYLIFRFACFADRGNSGGYAGGKRTHRSSETRNSLAKESWLCGKWCHGAQWPLRSADNAEHSHLRQSRARHEHPQAVAMQVRRRELNSAVNGFQQLIRANTLDRIAVAKRQLYPKALKL